MEQIDNDYELAADQELDYGQGAAEVQWAVDEADETGLDMANLPIRRAVLNVADMSPAEFTQIRRQGFGGSDASILIGANPYTKTYMEVSGKKGMTEPLVVQKARQIITEDEKQIGTLAAVRKGNDLENLIMKKAQAALGVPVKKPVHLYRFKDYPYLSMNFDGVGIFTKPKNKTITPSEYREEVPNNENLKYLYNGEQSVIYPAPDFSWLGNHHGYAPVEIKVATMTGQRHYNPVKAVYSESRLYRGQNPWVEAPRPLSIDELRSMSAEEKAQYFGIPIYYYPQVQQEMMAVDANGGFLAVLFDLDWQMHIFYIQKDPIIWNQLIIEGMKAAKAVNDIAFSQGRPPIMALTPDMEKELPKTTTLKQEAEANKDLKLVKNE